MIQTRQRQSQRMSGSEGTSDDLKFGADYILEAVPAGGT